MAELPMVDMFDFIGQDKQVQRIADCKPQKVAGYDTEMIAGTVKWTDEDWALFPEDKCGHVHIDQSVGLTLLAMGKSHVGDVETGAGTIEDFIHAAQVRWEKFQMDTTLYTSANNADDYHQKLTAAGLIDRINWWVADWSLNRAEAASRIGKNRVVAVQWASPSSNPKTLVPGSQTMTLEVAGVDLSVALASWHGPVHPPKPPVTTVTKNQAMVAYDLVGTYLRQA